MPLSVFITSIRVYVIFLRFPNRPLLQVNRIELPSVIICPKNPDALNFSSVFAELSGRIPNISESAALRLVNYAIADAGLMNMGFLVRNLSEADFVHLDGQVQVWRGRRTVIQFYKDLFEKHGYSCEQVSLKVLSWR